jgi:hypothetical protein
LNEKSIESILDLQNEIQFLRSELEIANTKLLDASVAPNQICSKCQEGQLALLQNENTSIENNENLKEEVASIPLN